MDTVAPTILWAVCLGCGRMVPMLLAMDRCPICGSKLISTNWWRVIR
jgi:rRNA maturation endonuclease Nob1